MKATGKLKQIAEKAKQDKKLKFTSLAHVISVESLAECYRELKKDKACGIDRVTVEGYGERLEENLENLVRQMKAKKYRPRPVRRVEIPKPGKKGTRVLGIPCVEDKIVQLMLKKILEAIYEQDFLEYSHGFCPEKSCHTAIKELDKIVMTRPVNYIVEVDIENFFDEVRHYWLLRCIEERVSDPNFMWLLRKFLKAGIEKKGTPQGGIASPVLANIYLHYILDLWFDRKYRKQTKGYVNLVRYCDDLAAVCEEREDADLFLCELKERFSKSGLTVTARIIEFGRRPWERAKKTGEKVKTFNFLGFTHYCTASRKGKFVLGHKTSKQNLSLKLKVMKEWLKKVRNSLPLKVWWPVLKSKLVGHYNYFGISGNMRSLKQFYYQVINLVFKWINRRSQKRSMNWDKYMRYLERYPLPRPRIYHSIYVFSPIK